MQVEFQNDNKNTFILSCCPFGSAAQLWCSRWQKCCLRNGPSLSRQNNNCRHRAYLLPTSKNCCFLPFMEKGQPSLSPYNLPMPFYIDYYTYTFCTVLYNSGVSNKHIYLINILSRYLEDI